MRHALEAVDGMLCILFVLVLLESMRHDLKVLVILVLTMLLLVMMSCRRNVGFRLLL